MLSCETPMAAPRARPGQRRVETLDLDHRGACGRRWRRVWGCRSAPRLKPGGLCCGGRGVGVRVGVVRARVRVHVGRGGLLGTGETAVLAPTYVSSGVGGKPAVTCSAVNVQILNGAGSTASINGTGNMVVGYDENPSALKQTGSHDLILGRNHSFTGYAQLLD